MAADTTRSGEAALEEKDRLHFDSIAASYARKDQVASTRIPREYQVVHCMQPVLERVGRVGTVVEIGCGIGRAAKYLKGHYDRYIGIDQSQQLIGAARVFNADCPAEFICANIKSPELPSSVADLVILIGALHHMTDVDLVIAALKRIAKPGADLVAFEPNNGNPVFQSLRWLRKKIDASYSSDQRFFSSREMRELLQKHGFGDIEIGFQGFCSPPFAEVVLRPQFLAVPLSRLAVGVDRVLDGKETGPLKFLSWNLVARARFPH